MTREEISKNKWEKNYIKKSDFISDSCVLMKLSFEEYPVLIAVQSTSRIQSKLGQTLGLSLMEFWP